MAATFGQYVALVEAQSRARETISGNLIAALLRMWRSFDRYYDGAAVEDLGARMGSVVLRSQVQTARSTEQYVRRSLALQSVPMPRPLDFRDYVYPRTEIAAEVDKVSRAADRNVDKPAAADVSTRPDKARARVTVSDAPDVRNSRVVVTVDDVYQRPARDVRYLVSVDTPLEDAVAKAEERLLANADVDLQMAARGASQRVLMSTDKITGWRRVLHPEMSKGGSCGLCIAASDRIYSKNDLMPIHHRCHCEVMPVSDDVDPGLRLNQDDLDRLYAEAGGTTRDKLKETRYRVNEHGELGPQLNREGGVSKKVSRPAKSKSNRAKQVDAQITALELSLRNLKARQANGENVDSPIKYHVSQLRRLNAERDSQNSGSNAA